ncbi:MAG: glycosyltransferase family 2 protein [Bacteroidota bacterium]
MPSRPSLLKELPPPPAQKSGWPWTEEVSPESYGPSIPYPKISLVTPSYNQGQYIEETIRSILLQNYPALEYIVMDGGSTDETKEILEKYSPWLTKWVSEPDGGQSDAINKGLAQSTGDLFNWCNSDDYFNPGALEKIGYAYQGGAFEAVFGKSALFGIEEVEGREKGTLLFDGNTAKAIGLASFSQPAIFFSKTAVDKMGPLSKSLHYAMDREWWIKWLLYFGADKAKEIPDAILNFRYHDDSKTVEGTDTNYKDINSISYSLAKSFGFDNYAAVIAEETAIDFDYQIDLDKGAISPTLIKSSLAYFMIAFANFLVFSGNRKGAKRAAKLIDTTDFTFSDKMYKYKLNLKTQEGIIGTLHDLLAPKPLK